MRITFRTVLSTGLASVLYLVSLKAQPAVTGDLQVFNGQRLGANLVLDVNTALNQNTWVSNTGFSLSMDYPGGQYTVQSSGNTSTQPLSNYGFLVFHGGADSPPTLDVTSFQALTLTMRGSTGSTVEIAIADSTEARHPGSETKVLVTLSSQWQTYYIPLAWFLGADLRHIELVAEVIFNGSTPQVAELSQITYTTRPPAPNLILPHFTYGGGATTTLYLTNRSGASIPVPLTFFNADGTPMNIPAPSNGSLTTGLTVLLGPQQTAVLSFPKTGSPVGGYVLAQSMADVSASADYRMTVPGQSDQKANFAFSTTTATSSTIVFDEMSSVTTLYIVNPSSLEANLTLTATAATGNQLGQATLKFPAGTKQSFALRSLPGMSAVAGNVGSLFIDARVGSLQSSGTVAVVAVASEGTILTTIPTTDR